MARSLQMSLIFAYLLLRVLSQDIQNYEDCIKAGYLATDSIPPICKTNEGKVFTKLVSTSCKDINLANCDSQAQSTVCGSNGLNYKNNCEACINNQVSFYILGDCQITNQIQNYDQCVSLGYPILESYPSQCAVPNVRTFIEEIQIYCTPESKKAKCYWMEYFPVCGDNKVEYMNSCEACASNQIDSYKVGKCKDLYSNQQVIQNFDDCVAAGFPIQDSFPEQCTTDDGRTFANSRVYICTQEQKQNHFCTKQYTPVCGNNKVDYSNSCVACSSNQIDSYQHGKCKDVYPDEQTINNFEDCVAAGFPIQESFPEQCTTDEGRTFINQKEYICTQEQKENSLCTREYNPVCGDNQVDYSNSCVACSSKQINTYKYGQCKDLFPNVQNINNFDDCVAAGFPILKSNPEQCVTDDGRTFINQIVYVCTKEQKESIACTMEYIPVCGDNGVTYGNKCSACSSGQIQEYTIGECSNDKNDQDINNFLDCIIAGYIQVDENPAKCITSDGKVFYDDILIECNEKFQNFDCQNYQFIYVCGDDRQIYQNPCEACQNNNFFLYGSCPTLQNIKQTYFLRQENWIQCDVSFESKARCTKQYDPACGDNGQTYCNECYACISGEVWSFLKRECWIDDDSGGELKAIQLLIVVALLLIQFQ